MKHICDFVASLGDPLGIPKPNWYKLVAMDLTICENYRVHCVDILDALTKNFLGTSGEIEKIPLENIKKHRPRDYMPITSTFNYQRENICSKIITRAIKKYIKVKNDAKISNILQ